MSSIWVWLADSPWGGALKAASGAVLVWLLDNVQQLDLPPVAQVALVAGLPVLINALNPMDDRYGMGKVQDVSDPELAED
jgi:hypothetical protein